MPNVITKDRLVESDFQQQINKKKVYVCERYFLPSDTYVCKFISKYVIAG